jgi:diguanylate cyclase (GGDEF)-like protein
LVKAFADQVSIALENVRLYSEAIHSANRFETLYRLSQVISTNLSPEAIYPAIHQAVSALMQTEFFSISLIDQENQAIRDVYMKDREMSQELGTRPLGTGLFSKVIEEGKSRLYNTFGQEALTETGAVLIGELDETEISQSVLVVPLKVGTRVIGVISAQSYQKNAYTENDQETLELLGANMAIAIENAKLFSEVQNLAITDPLTKLFNRRQFYQLSVREFEESKRYQRPLSVIMLDIDHFKRVNDTYGHSVGDQFLQQLAEICKNGLRQVDILARYGGEEFVVLMPQTSTEEALAIADRLRLDVSKTPIITQYGEMPVTISLGVVTQDENCKNLEELLDRSDQAMYASKRAGRNRVSLWKPELIPSPPSTEKILR